MPVSRIRCRDRHLDCPTIVEGVPVVMGILNVTPDSFSDGGRFLTPDAALPRIEEMISDGASIIDIGGESTRPRGATYGEGASAVDDEEEKRRVLPVIELVAKRFPGVVISIDTYKGSVARAAVDAGAHIINDVTGLRYGRESADVAAETNAALIVMHSIGKPGALPHDHEYGDVVREVTGSLGRSVAVARAAGVKSIVVDPGFGFGKSPSENLLLIARLDSLRSLGCPILIGISRKSTIGSVLGTEGIVRPVDERMFGTLGATATAVLRGASIVRTHDVRETVDFLRLMHETMQHTPAAVSDLPSEA